LYDRDFFYPTICLIRFYAKNLKHNVQRINNHQKKLYFKAEIFR